MKALVLVLRGLPAGAIGPYGNRWVETPTLNALAARGVVYDWHFAVHPGAPGAGVAWEWSRYSFPPVPPTQSPAGPGLLAALAAASIPTRRITDASKGNLDLPQGEWGKTFTKQDTASALSAAARAIKGLEKKDNWLVWVELHSLLPPWAISDEVLEAYFAPPSATEEEEDDDNEEDDEEEEDEEDPAAKEFLDEEERIEPLLDPQPGPIDPTDDVHFRRLQTTFAAAVTQLDLMLEELLEAVGDDALVLVTSDQGPALGEHGVVGPVRPWLHEEIVHVPLILAGPGCSPGRRVDQLTASVDLAATLATYFTVTLPEAQGHDIHPAVLAEGAPLRRYVCMGHAQQMGMSEMMALGPEGPERPSIEALAPRLLHAPVEWAIRTPDWFLRLPLAPGEPPRLYVKPDDRCEVNDVYQHHPGLAEALERTLRAFVEATRAPGPLQAPPLQLETPAEPLTPPP